MREINTKLIESSIEKLLAYAISNDHVIREYDAYIFSPNRKLYGILSEDMFVGCIGIELLDSTSCEIKHIAVSPEQRGNNLGSKMIDFIRKEHSLNYIKAETDKEAVGFYMKYGFAITSIGEKYPGVERFQCLLKVK